MELQRARDWADLFLKVLTMFALVVGGVWTFFQFRVTDTTASNIQITVSTEVQPMSADRRLLVVHVKPKNIGKVSVEPGRDGIMVVVRSIPSDVGLGMLDLEKMPEIYRANLMKGFPDGYELEPGVEYDELVALVVPEGSMYSIKATFDFGDETEVDHTAVARAD